VAKGGDVIQWHPLNAGDKNFSVVVVTVAANHLKAHDVGDPQDDVGGDQDRLVRGDRKPGRRAERFADHVNGPGNRLSSRHMPLLRWMGAPGKLQSTTKLGKILTGGEEIVDPTPFLVILKRLRKTHLSVCPDGGCVAGAPRWWSLARDEPQGQAKLSDQRSPDLLFLRRAGTHSIGVRAFSASEGMRAELANGFGFAAIGG